MKKIIPISLLSFLLLSCSGVKDYSLEDYQTIFEYKDGYEVMVLSDIHFSIASNTYKQFEYLKKVIYSKAAIANPTMDIVKELENPIHRDMILSYAPDVIMLNGDTFMTADRNIVREALKFFDSLDIPFGFLHGNHDLQGTYGSKFIDEELKKCENSIYKNPVNDKVTGDSNYVINLTQGNDVKWQIFGLDCNTYYNANYDNIKQNQVDWYEKQVLATENSQGEYSPSLIVTHIPIKEFEDAWIELTDGKMSVSSAEVEKDVGDSYWYLGEGVHYSPLGDNLFETIQELGGPTKGIISAHDHINISDFHYKGEYQNDVRLIFGVKTGDGIYNDDNFIGGSIYTLNSDGTFDSKHIFVPYGQTNEGNGVFVMTQEYIEKGGKI